MDIAFLICSEARDLPKECQERILDIVRAMAFASKITATQKAPESAGGEK